MIKRTRFGALTLAAIMMMSLAACGGSSAPASNNDKKDETPSTQAAAPVEESTEANLAEGMLAGTTDVEHDFSEPMTISFAGIQVTDGLDYNEGNDYYKMFHEKFNVTWDVTSLTFENWVERMNTWLNADDIPDWCVWNFNPGDAANYVEQDLVKRLPDDWKEKYPNLAAAAKATPANAFYENLYGGTYFLFRPVMATNFPADVITSHISVVVRPDLAEQAGYDMSKNLESKSISVSELVDYWQAVKDAGLKQYPYYCTAGKMSYIIDRGSKNSGCTQNAFYKGADGKYHWGPAEEETGVKEVVRKMKEAYDAGLIYPEFYTLTNDDDYPYFYSTGDAACTSLAGMAAWIDRVDTTMKSDLGLQYGENAQVLIITDDNGVCNDAPSTNYWACNIISPNIDDEKLDRLLSVWDYGCSVQGQYEIRMGVEGVDWEKDADGNLVNLLAETEYKDCNTKYTSVYPIYGNMFILSDDFSFINPGFSEMAREECADLYKRRAEITSVRGQEPDWALLSYSSQALNLASMTYSDEYANIITKEGDFDTNYDQWVADKMGLIQPVLDDMNATIAD